MCTLCWSWAASTTCSWSWQSEADLFQRAEDTSNSQIVGVSSVPYRTLDVQLSGAAKLAAVLPPCCKTDTAELGVCGSCCCKI